MGKKYTLAETFRVRFGEVRGERNTQATVSSRKLQKMHPPSPPHTGVGGKMMVDDGLGNIFTDQGGVTLGRFFGSGWVGNPPRSEQACPGARSTSSTPATRCPSSRGAEP